LTTHPYWACRTHTHIVSKTHTHTCTYVLCTPAVHPTYIHTYRKWILRCNLSHTHRQRLKENTNTDIVVTCIYTNTRQWNHRSENTNIQ
jgi:hypothetical protein